ncbi:MAG: 4Fe-4S binding protein [Desulfamplus sp.]|nr:4Fe-4S binding protein [Desulfamplus sp.]MBF0390825.1 4Fe-4S binding protein [Desulfamplus sp.]
MRLNSLLTAYFSPTTTTKKIVDKIAEGFNVEKVDSIDLTLLNDKSENINLKTQTGDIAILGAPVYSGRLPIEAIKRFRLLKGNNTPAIVVVVYGNRAYEDTLLELKNLAIEIGFKPVAAAAFIGEHSFSTKSKPIAPNRPDTADMQKAEDFGKEVKNRLLSAFAQSATLSAEKLDKIVAELKVPGNFPYKERAAAPPISPVTLEDECVKCGVCAQVCPTGAVKVEDVVTTDVQLCLRCCACIKNCPTGARVMEHPKMVEIANWLHTNFSERREPEIYFGAY